MPLVYLGNRGFPNFPTGYSRQAARKSATRIISYPLVFFDEPGFEKLGDDEVEKKADKKEHKVK